MQYQMKCSNYVNLRDQTITQKSACLQQLSNVLCKLQWCQQFC